MQQQPIKHTLRLKRLGISTYKEAVVYIHSDSYICKAEGFESQSRIKIECSNKTVIATLNIITSKLLKMEEASLSEYAWEFLGAKEGDHIYLSHPPALLSRGYVRTKIYGHELSAEAFHEIIQNIAAGYLSDIEIAAFICACAGNRINRREITDLTKAMLSVGSKMTWNRSPIVDKHCIGGVPGNRTTLIIVPIVAAFGLTIPKTSSRAITSSAGTADTMETLTPVNLTFAQMHKVVEQENGCVVWGNSAALSPADDMLIRVERVLNLDSHGQIVASVLSKKIAAGSTHVIIDIPTGPSSKIRNDEEKMIIKDYMEYVGPQVGIAVKTVFTDGSKPVGHGIGPALEAYDVLEVLQNQKSAPQDLKARALMLAGKILEFSEKVQEGEGELIARNILENGTAWQKFQNICEAQGGMRVPPKSLYQHVHETKQAGRIKAIDNRKIAKLAKLAGAPNAKAAGLYLEATVGDKIEKGQPLLTVHADSPGELDYALSFLKDDGTIIEIDAE